MLSEMTIYLDKVSNQTKLKEYKNSNEVIKMRHYFLIECQPPFFDDCTNWLKKQGLKEQ